MVKLDQWYNYAFLIIMFYCIKIQDDFNWTFVTTFSSMIMYTGRYWVNIYFRREMVTIIANKALMVLSNYIFQLQIQPMNQLSILFKV